MSDLIIYPREDGGVVLVIPTFIIPIEEVAKRDLPLGVPYKIISRSELPEDENFIDSWEADFSSPDGYAIGYEAWTAEQRDEQ